MSLFFILIPSYMEINVTACKGALPVRHAHDDVLHAVLWRLIDHGFQSRDQRLAALQAEAFLCRPLLLQELLKPEHTHAQISEHRRGPGWTRGCVRQVGRTWWSAPCGPAASSSPPEWTASHRESQTSAWSTDTAPGRWWTWTPRRCADSTPSEPHTRTSRYQKTVWFWFVWKKTLNISPKVVPSAFQEKQTKSSAGWSMDSFTGLLMFALSFQSLPHKLNKTP